LETPYAAQYEEEVNKSLLDLINLLYVVMTRPTDRLYVFTSMPPKKKDSTISVPTLIKKLLEEKGKWNESESIFSFGTKTLATEKRGEPAHSFKLNNFISNPWRNRMLISLQANKNWDPDEKTQRMKWGNLVHLILAQIQTAEDVDTILEKFESEGILNTVEKEKINTEIKSFLSHQDVSVYFQPGLKVKAEPEILLPTGKTFRPDRIVFGEREITVIDFKTGKPEVQHKDQVRHYINLMHEMGYTNTKGVLLYVSEPEPMVEVS
jgi:ATP-dependent exoDNAse (exonuclease V) beta subunit